jgi:hypothetical protein
MSHGRSDGILNCWTEDLVLVQRPQPASFSCQTRRAMGVLRFLYGGRGSKHVRAKMGQIIFQGGQKDVGGERGSTSRGDF